MLTSSRFQSAIAPTRSGKKMAVHLNIAVAASRAVGLSLADEVAECLSSVGKQHKETIKLKVSADTFSD